MVSCFVYLVSDVRDMVNTADCCDGFLGVFRNGAVQPEFGALHVVSVGAGTRGFGELLKAPGCEHSVPALRFFLGVGGDIRNSVMWEELYTRLISPIESAITAGHRQPL